MGSLESQVELTEMSDDLPSISKRKVDIPDEKKSSKRTKNNDLSPMLQKTSMSIKSILKKCGNNDSDGRIDRDSVRKTLAESLNDDLDESIDHKAFSDVSVPDSMEHLQYRQREVGKVLGQPVRRNELKKLIENQALKKHAR